jgi:hypothetical protein
VKLTIANILTASGSAEFDTVTQTTTIATLLSELSLEMVLEYIESLCDVLKSSLLLTATPAAAAAVAGSDEQEQENVADPSSCIYSLYALTKNPKLVERGTVTAVILSILLRLSCYGQGITPEVTVTENGESKKKKKSSKKTSAAAAPCMTSILTENGISAELASRIVTMVRRVEGVVQEHPYLPSEVGIAPSSSSATPVGVVALVRAARSRFLTMLSELTYQTIDGLNKSQAVGKEDEDDHQEKKEKVNTGPTFLQFANTLVEFFESIGLSTHKELTTVSSSAMELEGADEEDEAVAEEAVTVKNLLRELKETMTVMRGHGPEVIPMKLLNSFEVLLIHTTFHILCSDEIDLEPLRVMLIVLPQILEKYKNKPKANVKGTNTAAAKTTSEDEEEDDEDEDDPQAELLDCCIDLLAVSASHSIKGIRDAIKKIWMSIIHFCGLHQDGLEAVLLAVIADDTMNEEGGEDDDEEEEDGEDDEEDEEHDHDHGEHEEEEEEDDDEEEEESEEEDDEEDGQKKKRQVTEEEVIQLLEDEELDLGEDNEEDLEDALVHVESADDALVQMIKMRKQSRKQGLLQAKRQEYIIRSRAIDILEVCPFLFAFPSLALTLCPLCLGL